MKTLATIEFEQVDSRLVRLTLRRGDADGDRLLVTLLDHPEEVLLLSRLLNKAAELVLPHNVFLVRDRDDL